MICFRECEYYIINIYFVGMVKNVVRVMLGLEFGGGSEVLCWCIVGDFNDDVLLSLWVDVWYMGMVGLL